MKLSVHKQVQVWSRRREVLYRFAHLADFSNFSPCKNVRPDEFDVLYFDSSRK